MNYIIVHYSEIALKTGNRRFFEEKLAENVKSALNRARTDFEFVKITPGRILVKLKNGTEQNGAENAVKNVFGISYFSFAIKSEQNINSIQETALKLLKEPPVAGKFKTFKISAKRAEKKFPLNSQQINERVGEFIVKNLKKKVDLENPDAAVFIEIAGKDAFLYLKKIKGLGGLPAGVSGKGIVLISGGIDSPVAAYFAQKRGVETIYLHFHSYPYTSKNSIKRAEELVKILNKFQLKSKLILAPFAEIQQEIVSSKIDEKLRVVLYRRFMMKIAEIIAKKEKADVLITGESVGQVASQTLKNIKAIEEAVKIPVLRPLCGFDKEEIINIARSIGTFETSILPCDDTCSLFAPAHPETRAELKNVKLAEKKLNVKKLISKTIKGIEIKNI